MNMQFVRMIQFTRLVKAEGRLREFNFRKLSNNDEETFNVNVCTERGERIFFSMQKKDAHWRIVPKELPSWIMQSEKALNEVMEDELKNF